MDANKLTVLREVGYSIRPHCGIWIESEARG